MKNIQRAIDKLQSGVYKGYAQLVVRPSNDDTGLWYAEVQSSLTNVPCIVQYASDAERYVELEATGTDMQSAVDALEEVCKLV